MMTHYKIVYCEASGQQTADTILTYKSYVNGCMKGFAAAKIPAHIVLTSSDFTNSPFKIAMHKIWQYETEPEPSRF